MFGSRVTKPTHVGVRIQPVSELDWPHIYPVFPAIVAKGRKYAYPGNLSSEEARTYWTVTRTSSHSIGATGQAWESACFPFLASTEASDGRRGVPHRYCLELLRPRAGCLRGDSVHAAHQMQCRIAG